VILLCALVLAADLAGIRAVDVVVEKLPAEFTQKSGFNEQNLSTDIELKLRRHGVPLDKRSGPYIHVSTQLIEDEEKNFWAFRVEVSLREPAVLERTAETAFCSTWRVATIGIVGVKRLAGLRSFVSDAADEFINDWLKANPPARSGSFSEFMERERPRVIVPPGPLGSQPVTKKY
jgi:hypothetical protein